MPIVFSPAQGSTSRGGIQACTASEQTKGTRVPVRDTRLVYSFWIEIILTGRSRVEETDSGAQLKRLPSTNS